MDILTLIIKILVLLASVFCMVLPFLLNKAARDKDRKNKISYKYFRILIFSLVYAIAATVAIALLKDLYQWISSLRFVQWIAARIAITPRTQYFIAVFSTILINTAIGFLYLLFQKLVRIGLKKKNLVTPKKNGKFNWRQKAERAVIRFFHNETWFLVGRILKWFNILLSAAYIIIFILYQIPALSDASWIPYNFLLTLYNAGYIYPAITLLVLWDMYYFLSGIEMVDKECPEVLNDNAGELKKLSVDMDGVNEECKKYYSDRYLCEIEIPEKDDSMDVSAETDSAAVLVGQAMEKDSRNPKLQKALYINCIDNLSKDKNLVIEGGFFSEFGMYFLRYISMILARGENVVFICNSDEQIDATYSYVFEGLSNISSLYCKGVGAKVNDYDAPIWGILKVSSTKIGAGKSSLDDQSVLITTPDYICSSDFEMKHKEFIQLINTIIYVDTVETLTLHAPLMSLMNTRFQHIARINAVIAKNSGRNVGFRSRFVFRPIRYVCFDDSMIHGLDKVLKNLLSVDFETTDCMQITSDTLISCYNHEGEKDDQGKTGMAQFVHTDEELGLIMNMIMLCRSKGIDQVTVFPNNALPYNNMIESAISNSAKLPFSLNRDDVRVNKYYYNPDKYSAIIAFDPLNNLPDAIRRYARLAGDKPTLVNIISRPYLLRDYYAANIGEMWQGRQIIRIPMRSGTSRDAALRILVKANSGGVSEEELFIMAGSDSELAKTAASGNANAVMISLLKYFGITGTDSSIFHTYFEYSTERDFDENGVYKLENRIHLRKQGKLYDLLEGRNLIRICHGNRVYVLPMAKDRLTQRYIAGQNLLYNGDVYHITAIDIGEGVIHAKLATGGKNEEAYEYIQDRRYVIDNSAESIEMLQPVKRVHIGRDRGNVEVTGVTLSAFRAPMEVVTDGYYVIDPHTMDCNPKTNSYISIKDELYAVQTYRRYGTVKSPAFTSEQVISCGGYIDNNGASVLSVRIGGSFGEDADKTSMLAAVMLTEILKSMFPYITDSVAVVPVLKNSNLGEDCGCQDIIKLYPQISLTDRSGCNEGIELLIIEDCSTDLGVISTIMSSGDDPLHMLFAPVLEYLDWYAEPDNTSNMHRAIKKDYLYFGDDKEPACFDFKSVHDLAGILGDDRFELNYVDMEALVEYSVCDFCGKRFVKGENIVQMEDGRMMCRGCADQIVGNNKRALKEQLINAKLYLENTYGIKLDDDYEMCFDSTVKILNTIKADQKLLKRGSDAALKGYIDPAKKKAHVERDIPASGVAEILVRQLTHIWQLKHVPDLPEDLAEGHIALVAVQYLRFLGLDTLADKRVGYYESNNLSSGIGYRKLIRELLKYPQFKNNPFRYVLENQGGGVTEEIDDTQRDLDLGDDYVPEEPDRVTDGNVPMFFYDRLSDSNKTLYTTLCKAIENFETTCDAGSASFDDVQTVLRSMDFDKPELFQYKTFSMQGSCVNLIYCMDAAERTRLMTEINNALPQFTEGITDNMSAYDVALRVHTNIIKVIDYDTIALERQEKTGIGETELDWLRTICGVFLRKTAVCAGYARAVQFLLQKYGIESGYCVGDMLKKDANGQVVAHAWNILKVDGDYYYMDATWDDASNTVQKVKRTELSYKYFCVTTEEMLRTRLFNWCPVEMPVCTATKCNYHYHNNAVIDSYDLKRVKEIAAAAAARNADEFSIKCTSAAVYKEAFDKLCRNSADGFAAVREAAKTNKRIQTTTFGYSHDETMRVITVNFKY